MIPSQEIGRIAKKYQDVFSDLKKLRERLCVDFHDMENAVTALVLAVATRETLLFLGPPGTAKSALIRRLCVYLGMPGVENWQDKPGEDEERRYFEYLLTAFTEPAELFGFLELNDLTGSEASKESRPDEERKRGQKKTTKGRIERITENMILGAEVVYLDEIFNASSAILNSLLAFLNEGRFHDRGRIIEVNKEQLLFAASNHIPRTDELKAVYDRFLIRCQVNNLHFDGPEKFGKLGGLVATGLRQSYGKPKPLELRFLKKGLPVLRKEIGGALAQAGDALAEASVKANDGFLNKMGFRMHNARRRGLGEFSNRRVIRMLRVMIFHRMWRYVEQNETVEKADLGDPELALLPRYFIDRFDREAERLQSENEANPTALNA